MGEGKRELSELSPRLSLCTLPKAVHLRSWGMYVWSGFLLRVRSSVGQRRLVASSLGPVKFMFSPFVKPFMFSIGLGYGYTSQE